MSDNNAPQIKYDAFVSFRGEDVRHGFLSHLTEAFHTKKINAFVDDDRLKTGDEIWESLVGAIEGSSISLIIFSPDYASSRWCLDELVKIHECRDKHRRIVIPIFYQVEPKNVRHQLGSYKNSFIGHVRKHETKVKLWKDALHKSADLSGIESSNFQNEAKLVKEIVNLVMMRLAKPPINSKGLVGIDEKIADVELLIREESKDTRLIGIWGMGGIGKTTLAEEVFIKLRSKYDGCYFVANEREQSRRHGIISLKKEIFSELTGSVVKIDTPNSLPEDIVRKIGCMKVLIVLDDVNDLDHIEKLLGTLGNFGSGSIIIVTTRDEQVLKANKVDKTYQLKELSSDKALELFNLNAFKQSDHQREYNEISERVVDYAQGIPLVVKVLAHLLCRKNKEVWESELDKLRKMPPTEVCDVMKLSYDGLDRKEQQIFLDLACFFLRSQITVNVGNLKLLLRDDESDNSIVVGLERLKDKALITFSENNFVSMHNCLQEMAWEIVHHKSSKPGSCSWLWDPNDGIYEALKNDKGTEAIRSIQINLSTAWKQKLIPNIFAKMSKLQFLEISGGYNDDLCDQLYTLAVGLQFLATELRFLRWLHYPLKSLPENFSAEKLVILTLPYCKMEKLWDGIKNLVNLKEVDLCYSKTLKELPDLSKATNLEVLILRGCSMLTSVHPSIFSLVKLEKLDLWDCKSLTILASDSQLCSLSYLNLEFCENLTEFSLISENMKELNLDNTKVRALPSSFGYQCKLKSLHLRGSNVERLPSSFNNLMQLLHLDISSCHKLQTIPELPRSFKTLEASNCRSLQTLPELPHSLETLNVTSCTSLQTLPELPPFLKTLNARDCKSLKTALFPLKTVEQLKENRKQVLFWNCWKLDEYSLVAIGLNAQINVMKFASQHLSTPNHHHVENYNDYDVNHGSYQAVYVYPGSIVPKWMKYKTTNDHIIIDLSPAPSSVLLGFIFCFILDSYRDTYSSGRLEVDITVSDGDGEGEGKKDSVRMYIDYYSDWSIASDHVCVMYDQRCSNFLISIAKNKKSFKIEVTMGARIGFYNNYHAQSQQVLKGFGVSPISTSAYNSFIQQMELHDSMSQFH